MQSYAPHLWGTYSLLYSTPLVRSWTVLSKPTKSMSTDADVTTVFPQERPRPEFAAMAPTMEQNPVTGVKEPYFPEKTRLSRMFTGSMVIIMMVRH